MQKIKLNERQVLMLQKLQEGKSRSKLMKINEDQYNRLFKNAFNANKNISKEIGKNNLDEESKKTDLLNFAQEVIVFIKDMLSRPESAPFSKFWAKKGISKEKLISMLEKEGLLTMNLGEGDGPKTYVTEKFGFRKKIKEFYNTINELGDGYPAGAANDPSAPWNQSSKFSRPKSPKEKPLTLLWFSNEAAIFKDIKGEKYVFNYTNIDKSEFETYAEREETDRYQADDDHYIEYSDEWEIDEHVVEAFVNDNLKSLTKGEGYEAYHSGAELVLIDDELASVLVEYFNDKRLTNLLLSVGETTGAASSGSYVGGMSGGPIKKNTGNSPEDEMKNIISDGVDSSGVVEYHSDRNGEEPFEINGIKWQYVNALYDGKLDIGVYRYGQDLTYSYEWFNNNILKNGVQETELIENNEGESLKDFISRMGNKLPKQKYFSGNRVLMDMGDGTKEELTINKVVYHKPPKGEFNYGYYTKEYGDKMIFIEPMVLNNLQEMDSITAGGESGTFAYDAPAGDGSKFWNAGNKENKGNAKKPQTMPIVRGGMFTENIKVGQVYKNGIGRRKINDINKLTGVIKVRQWGDGKARDLTINRKQFGDWELIHEQAKVLKITEAQLKRLLEANNQTSTAYPNGEMVKFDDCVKLNNNKVAQNGGCSQGDDGVVKLQKTKSSVVSEEIDNKFNPNVSAGSIYAVEVKLIKNGSKLMLSQDNGQHIVVDYDSIGDLLKVINSFYK